MNFHSTAMKTPKKKIFYKCFPNIKTFLYFKTNSYYIGSIKIPLNLITYLKWTNIMSVATRHNNEKAEKKK